jgi:triosephosphate isomerase
LPLGEVDAVLCPPFTALAAARDALAGSAIGLGAQNVCWVDEGAFTGEISPAMLVECGVRWVVIGHSERRHLFGELDYRVNEMARAALAHGITPIVAVGETAAEHAAGQARDKVCAQIQAAFAGVTVAVVARCVVAYEPIWAIGTGNADSPAEADHIMGEIRAKMAGLHDARILYGGSMKPDNVAAFLAQPNIDGGLIGGASLEPDSFAALLEGARA